MLMVGRIRTSTFRLALAAKDRTLLPSRIPTTNSFLIRLRLIRLSSTTTFLLHSLHDRYQSVSAAEKTSKVGASAAGVRRTTLAMSDRWTTVAGLYRNADSGLADRT